MVRLGLTIAIVLLALAVALALLITAGVRLLVGDPVEEDR